MKKHFVGQFQKVKNFRIHFFKNFIINHITKLKISEFLFVLFHNNNFFFLITHSIFSDLIKLDGII